jgi:hypothetical protein
MIRYGFNTNGDLVICDTERRIAQRAMAGGDMNRNARRNNKCCEATALALITVAAIAITSPMTRERSYKQIEKELQLCDSVFEIL